MKSLIIALCAIGLSTGVQAAELNFPSDEPVATVTIPDSWGPKETETGIDATSADKAVYISVDIADAGTSDKVIDDAVKYLEDNGVKIDGSTQKQTDDKLNGMDMSTFVWDGTDADGPANVGLAVLSPKAGKLLVITYWGTKGEQEKHGAEIDAIMSSLQPVQ